MNTRLQVEHPVTELVTGIRPRARADHSRRGRALSFRQEDVAWRGHAIECRVYAEEPREQFPPVARPHHASARALRGRACATTAASRPGAEVSIYYDPMISKLAAWGRTREEAIDRLRRALDEYAVGGIKTTLPFFREIVRDAEFIEGRLDTGFIARFFERRAAKSGARGRGRDRAPRHGARRRRARLRAGTETVFDRQPPAARAGGAEPVAAGRPRGLAQENSVRTL